MNIYDMVQIIELIKSYLYIARTNKHETNRRFKTVNITLNIPCTPNLVNNVSVEQGCTNFINISAPPQNSTHQKRNKKKIRYCGSTIIRRRRKKFRSKGYLDLCTPALEACKTVHSDTLVVIGCASRF